jgi:HEAT repeat protein
MRYFQLGIFLISVSGCGGAPPAMAGGKWAKALRDPSAKVRKQAAFTLGNIGPSDPTALPALIGALKDTESAVRCEAILALVKFGPAAREARPALLTIRQRDGDPRARSFAARALEKLEKR